MAEEQVTERIESPGGSVHEGLQYEDLSDEEDARTCMGDDSMRPEELDDLSEEVEPLQGKGWEG